MYKRQKCPAPRDTQIKRIRWNHGLSEQFARVIAELHFGKGHNANREDQR